MTDDFKIVPSKSLRPIGDALDELKRQCGVDLKGWSKALNTLEMALSEALQKEAGFVTLRLSDGTAGPGLVIGRVLRGPGETLEIYPPGNVNPVILRAGDSITLGIK